MKKVLTVNNLIKALAIILALVGGIIFLVTATSGYLKGNTYNIVVFVFALLGILFIIGSVLVDIKFPKFGVLLLIVASLFLSLAFANGVLDRVNFIGDSFIPMDYPASFYAALGATYACLILFVVSAAILAVSCFIPEIALVKERDTIETK